MNLKIDFEIQNFVKRSISIIIIINSNFKSIYEKCVYLLIFLILVNRNL